MTHHRWRYDWNAPMESGLVIAVPEADDVVADIRRRFDPNASVGVPPHVTVLYPFYEPVTVDDDVRDRITDALRGSRPFSFHLTAVASFEGSAVYLVPTPAEPFVALTMTLWESFPDRPPFGGEFDEVIPHLTVGWADRGATADAIGAEIGTQLPIACSARELTLLVERDDGWEIGRRFPLRDA